MGLYRRGKTYWFSIQYASRRIHQSLNTDNKRLADKLYAKVITDMVDGRYFDLARAKKHSFDELMDKFMLEYAVKREGSTRIRYVSARNNLSRYFKGYNRADLSPETLSSYVQFRRQEGVKAAAVNRELGLLSKAFNIALRQWEWFMTILAAKYNENLRTTLSTDGLLQKRAQDCLIVQMVISMVSLLRLSFWL